jgi:excisionase family DNA binding protein
MVNEGRTEDAMELRELEVYTIEEVARILKVSQTTVRRKIKTGELQSRRLGRLHRISGADLRRLISGPEPIENKIGDVKKARK